MPVLVGEWFYRQRRPDAGTALPPLFPEVADQQEQAARYRVYARNLARMPFTVGQHWFQWMDQPKEGRADGENQLIGVVDIDDNLKPPLAAAMRTINGTLIQRHQRCVSAPERQRLLGEGAEAADTVHGSPIGERSSRRSGFDHQSSRRRVSSTSRRICSTSASTESKRSSPRSLLHEAAPPTAARRGRPRSRARTPRAAARAASS